MSLYPNAFRGPGECYGGNHYCAKHEQHIAECENATLRTELAALRERVAGLQESLLYEQRLAFRWMREHDVLLGFVQARPAVLKELIEDDPRTALGPWPERHMNISSQGGA